MMQGSAELQCIAECEQCMTPLLDEHLDELNTFAMAPGLEHNEAKAFLNFAIARHLSLKSLDEQSNQTGGG